MIKWRSNEDHAGSVFRALCKAHVIFSDKEVTSYVRKYTDTEAWLTDTKFVEWETEKIKKLSSYLDWKRWFGCSWLSKMFLGKKS